MADAGAPEEPPVQDLEPSVQKEIEAEVEEPAKEPAKEEETNADVFDINNHTYEIPNKKVNLPTDISQWEKSEAYRDLVGFICAISDAVKSKKIRDTYPVSETITKLVGFLDTMDTWIDEIPPIDQPQRFGNKAFKDFYTRLKDNGETHLRGVLDERFHPAIPEIVVYLREGVGNDTRIDYGTGHELSFVAFLCCLFKIGALQEEDAVSVALRVFQRYLVLMRKLQQTYRMEPAGSQGVWSLDDHQFIPFIWGSSQLIDHQRILPKSFVKSEIFENFDKDFMFLGCIKYLSLVKTGPFAEHSNQLWNISGVKLWQKVNSGLIKMYKAEVLAKFPVIQHFLFGSLLPFRVTSVT